MIAGFSFALITYIVGNSIFASYLQITYIEGSGELAIICAALVGSSLGFLWFYDLFISFIIFYDFYYVLLCFMSCL